MRTLFIILFIFLFNVLFANKSINNELPDSGMIVVHKIIIEGNKITKDYIVLRELLLKEGDTLLNKDLSERIKKSSENVMNTSLFNFVTIMPEFDNKNGVKINIKLIERWYVWPIPEFNLADRNFNTWWKTKDFNRVNYGIDLTAYNFRGRKETLSFIFSLGYDENYGIAYTIPYLDNKKTLGLTFEGGIMRNHEVAYNTTDNKIEFFKETDTYLKKQIYSTLGFTYRRSIHYIHTLNLSYFNYYFADTLLNLNKDYSINKNTFTGFLSLSYHFKIDYRDYRPYPLKGSYFDIKYIKNGMGLLTNEEINTYSIESSIRKYWKLNQRLYFASGLTLMHSSESPYFLNNGLGYGRDFVRSYEYYVINGQSFGLLKTNIKYNLIPPKVKKINIVKTEKFNTIPYAFYVNLFADAGYVKSKESELINPLNNQLLLGGGIGLDFVTYYDKVIRIEYSINKKGESGVFIHFMTSI
ncbi:MAG: POTRA domain-containing protein [Bacteroidota bacterium]